MFAESSGWKCMLPQYSLQYTKTPIFVVNSFADTYQLPNVMGISGCSKSHCSRSDLHYINSFRRELLTAIDGSLGGKGGYWITDCPVHTIADHSDFYNGVLVDGKFTVPLLVSSSFLRTNCCLRTN
jgi:Pectinacetylesterase